MNTIAVPIFIMNLDQFIFDQIQCICMSSNKIDKRQKRALYVADSAMKSMHTIPDGVLTLLNDVIAIRQQSINVFPLLTISQQEIQNYLEMNGHLPVLGNVTRIQLGPTLNVIDNIDIPRFNWKQVCSVMSMIAPVPQQDAVKKAAEALVTALLCNMDGLYDLSCDIFKKIIARLFVVDEVVLLDVIRAKRIIFLIKNADIIFELKGGMAWKRFMEFFSDAKEVNKVFSNGDNDTSILVNPDLRDYDIVHDFLCAKIRRIMIELIPGVMPGLRQFISYAEENGIEVNGYQFPLLHTPVCGFSGQIVGNDSVITFDQERVLKVQLNELKFVLFDNYQSHFALLRYKLPFKCLDRILCAEILDISVPYKTDCFIRSSFADKGSMTVVDMVIV